ncbi:MAG TPA: TIGR04190 family B12-binding domain/radical SAM domain protein [Anaerolineales bacterium]
MTQPDLVLIHPPSVFDFRQRTIFFGPLSDVIPSSPVFEMYPVGFLTLAAFLRRHGYRVQIVNLALRMMRSPRFRPEPFLQRLHPALFGIDLHWLAHAQGGPAVAALLKRLHPDIPIVFGGISATYFHQELILDPAVDFVLRGSVTEPHLLGLLREIAGERRFESVPNLTWKDDGAVRINPPAPDPLSLDGYGLDLGSMVASVGSRLDFWTSVPFGAWWHHPITAVFTVRGCARQCVTCGASEHAFQRFMPGRHPVLRSPDCVAEMVGELADVTRAPIFLVGDLRDGGEAYAGAVVDALARRRVSNRIVFEFFEPPPPDLLARIDASIARWGAELSPESHDEAVRTLLGKASYTNAALESAMGAILRLRCEQLDMFFMIGLPGQTYRSVMETVEWIGRRFDRFDRRLSAFLTPLGPFLDPGSDGFERAEAVGYRVRARTLAEHKALLEQPDWESSLNYETLWMTRAEIVDATYDAAERLHDLKRRHGRITPGQARRVQARLQMARSIQRKLREERGLSVAARVGPALLGEVRSFEQGILNDKAELFPPRAFLANFRLGGILRLLVRSMVRRRLGGRPPYLPAG